MNGKRCKCNNQKSEFAIVHISEKIDEFQVFCNNCYGVIFSTTLEDIMRKKSCYCCYCNEEKGGLNENNCR